LLSFAIDLKQDRRAEFPRRVAAPSYGLCHRMGEDGMRSQQVHFAIAAVATAAFTAGLASANIVNNPGFETGDFTGWGTQAAAVGSAFEVSPFQPLTGTYSVYLHGTGGQYDEFYQTLSTDPGQEYLVSFWVYNNGVGDDSLRVDWEGNPVILHTPVSTELEMWVQVSTQVVATGPS